MKVMSPRKRLKVRMLLGGENFSSPE
jgi:hypothetical protein